MKNLDDLKKETLALLEYNCPGEHRGRAADLVEEFADDRIAANALNEFYRTLPDAREDAVVDLRIVARKGGVFLLCALTAAGKAHLCLASMEEAAVLGPLDRGPGDGEVLAFFGIADNGEFLARFADPERLPQYRPVGMDPSLCPACGAAEGEPHVLGCPVEVCPWCAGQLTACNCRFEKTGKERLRSERDIDRFAAMLEEAGRIPYRREDRPGFPGR